MAFHKGAGGFVKFAATTQAIHKWTKTFASRKSETTNSGSSPNSTFLPTVLEGSGTIDIPWDDAATPESVGFTEGTLVTIQCQLGDAAHYHSGPALIDSIAWECDNMNGHVKMVVNWTKNGAWTYS